MDETKTLDITKFSPPVAELQKIVSETKLVTLDDLGSVIQLKKVKENRGILKSCRVKIKKYGKELRQDALKFQKDVIIREKELIAIIEPEEKRLANLEIKAQEHIERERQVALIPQRRERLSEIDALKITDEELIAMDDTEFQTFCNKVLADKNERERIEVEAERDRVNEEKIKLAQEKEVREAEERARINEREKAELERKEREDDLKRKDQEAKDRIAHEEREAKERIALQEEQAKEKIRQEEEARKRQVEAVRIAKEDAERAKIEEQEARKKESKFKEWLETYGYTVEGYNDLYLIEVGGKSRLYKLISTYEDN